MTARDRFYLCLAAVYLCAWPLSVQADVPATLEYQGRLVTDAGEDLGGETSGTYRVRFDLFENGTSETSLWAESRDVAVVNGHFHTVLGSAEGNPTPEVEADLREILKQPNPFLQITLLSGPDITDQRVINPRQQISSVPFALHTLDEIPAGTVILYGGNTAPEGWALCNGAPCDGDQPAYADLYEVIDPAFHTGNGKEFLLPDLRGRTVLGAGTGTGLTPRVVGENVGSESMTLLDEPAPGIAHLPAHHHNVRDTGHSHRLRSPSYDLAERGGDIGAELVVDYGSGSGGTSRRTSRSSVSIAQDMVGGNQSFNIMQPSLVLNYIIKL